MKNLTSYFIAILLPLFLAGGCSMNEPDNENKKPVIYFDAEQDVYKVKVGRNLLLEPRVTNNKNLSYRWEIEGVTVGTEMTYLFSSQESGQVFVTFEVANSQHTVSKEIRIDVMPELPPGISMAVPDGGFILLAGTEKKFKPSVTNADNAVFEWYVNDEQVSDTKDYIFCSEHTGEYSVKFRAGNEDGYKEVRFVISVRNQGDIPFSWEWENDIFNMTLGRVLLLAPVYVSSSFDALYTWKSGDDVLQEDRNVKYVFKPLTTGEYLFTVTMQNEYVTVSKKITVNVYDNEEGFLRGITGTSSADAGKVWEFLPAPGQFVNEYYTANDMDEACDYAEGRLAQSAYVSLGAFGGYIIVGFDHSVINDGDYNIQILGNSFDGSSEPGIVWVMQDENGDGLPNDTWYELKGSEYGKEETLQDYAVTYYKPNGPGKDVVWTDNLGGEGTIDYLGQHHRQDYYYPSWVKTSSYTLRGTRLKDRTVDRSGNGTYWYHGSFEWGYADNYSSIDRLTEDNNHNASVNANHFKISNAVDRNGNTVNLRYIDFVKIQTGVQAKAGWLGENSTEVYGIRDYNIVKSE